MLKVHSSRRVAGLKPGDYDHEISLVDHDSPVSPSDTNNSQSPIVTRTDTASRLLPPTQNDSSANSHAASVSDSSGNHANGHSVPNRNHLTAESPDSVTRPSVEVSAPASGTFHEDDPNIVPRRPRVERETAIDILYENQRGGFLCRRALFSAAALGGLDPTPWTNAYHNPSPTSIHTAQVPDPSWEWVWPEWHINHQEGLDEYGWEYSFAFSKKFSWHGPKWWNSFVRRRAWTRKRARKRPEDLSADMHMSDTKYFTVRSTAENNRLSLPSLAGSRVPSKTSLTQVSTAQTASIPDMEDIETLLGFLRTARIDREKLDAVENYLENGIDLGQLQDEMHEIMSLFVFQASRKLLLTRLMHFYDDTVSKLESSDSAELRHRKEALEAAIRHADEEARKLAYWSDIKQMAESGETGGAVDAQKGWDDSAWQGVDNSGPLEPNHGKLPGTGSQNERKGDTGEEA
ncbi:hypothetical protein B0I35DRAFT_121682 [Stachybotrys elegans]|uniref:Peroxin/Ferlin domain-containing protein n=1 Tax=Stachybotrys elegans TaxID=80388 RepID=A0A8K0WUQ4_9HYPO|nr:hypothetical protein B0I35DRAFT_121682 [Stachybotrys elegans]